MTLLYYFTLVAMVVLALVVVFSKNLRSAALVFGLFSGISTLAYLLLAAPDVALAQAIIGCTISTIILLAGIKKYHIYIVCALPSRPETESAVRQVVSAQAHSRELETHFITKPAESEMHKIYYDLGYRAERDTITLYGEKNNYILQAVKEQLAAQFPSMTITVHYPAFREID